MQYSNMFKEGKESNANCIFKNLKPQHGENLCTHRAFQGRPASFPGLTRCGDLECVATGQDMN